MNARPSDCRVTALTCFVLLYLGAVAQAQEPFRCPQDFLERQLINRLVAARTAAEIDKMWKKVAAPDAVTRLMYAVRRSQLAPGAASDQLLIAAIPADSVAFDLTYSLCYPRPDDTSKQVAEIAGGSWIDLALEAVVRRGYGHSKILMLPYVGRHNADIGEVIPCIVDKLKDRAPRQYAVALERLPEAARELVCPDCC